ncbi:MAG: hypothetical protein WDN00_18095 [Limisphaerales bacterium]
MKSAIFIMAVVSIAVTGCGTPKQTVAQVQPAQVASSKPVPALIDISYSQPKPAARSYPPSRTTNDSERVWSLLNSRQETYTMPPDGVTNDIVVFPAR